MPFPSTSSSEYSKLLPSVRSALSRLQEAQYLEFKSSESWDNLCWRLLKTTMAMGNLRDGGRIIIGVRQEGNECFLDGIKAEHLATFDYDNILDQLSKFSSPQLELDIVVHEDEGKQFLVFDVRQFDETPIVCRKNSPDGLKSNDRLVKGDIYIRPASGKPQTKRLDDASEMHSVLELAAEQRATRMLQVGRRIGLIEPIADNMFDKELDTIHASNDFTKELPHWRFLIRPKHFNPILIPTLTACTQLVEQRRVQLRGWDFPHLPLQSERRLQGSNWIGTEVTFQGTIEFWRLFQSGQFIQVSAVREATEPDWRSKLESDTKSHLRHLGERDWSKVPGFISITNTIYNIAEFFEFISRLCQSGMYNDEIEWEIEINRIRGFVLTTDWNRSWSYYCDAKEDSLSKEGTARYSDLITNSADISLKTIVWFCECFGWISPNEEQLKRDLENYLAGRQ